MVAISRRRSDGVVWRSACKKCCSEGVLVGGVRKRVAVLQRVTRSAVTNAVVRLAIVWRSFLSRFGWRACRI